MVQMISAQVPAFLLGVTDSMALWVQRPGPTSDTQLILVGVTLPTPCGLLSCVSFQGGLYSRSNSAFDRFWNALLPDILNAHGCSGPRTCGLPTAPHLG